MRLIRQIIRTKTRPTKSNQKPNERNKKQQNYSDFARIDENIECAQLKTANGNCHQFDVHKSNIQLVVVHLEKVTCAG